MILIVYNMSHNVRRDVECPEHQLCKAKSLMNNNKTKINNLLRLICKIAGCCKCAHRCGQVIVFTEKALFCVLFQSQAISCHVMN